MPFKDKEARNAYNREYKAKRRSDPAYKEKELEKERERYQTRKELTHEKRLAKNARYREKNRQALSEKERERVSKLKREDLAGYYAKVKERSSAYTERHKDDESFREKQRKYASEGYNRIKNDEDFKEKNRARVRAWQAANKDRNLARVIAWRRDRYKNDVQFKLEISLRRRLYMAVKGNHRSGIAVRELGCSIVDFKTHLESMFTEGMTWENWRPDGWHIDHIRPISSFDLTDPEQVKAACHYTNLQPLWAKDNLSKSDRFTYIQPKENWEAVNG